MKDMRKTYTKLKTINKNGLHFNKKTIQNHLQSSPPFNLVKSNGLLSANCLNVTCGAKQVRYLNWITI